MATLNLKDFTTGLINAIEYVKQNNFFKITSVVLQIAFWIMILVSAVNYDRIFNWIVDRTTEVDKIRHKTLMDYRFSINDEIHGLLEQMCHDTGAKGAWIFEFHNGSNNLSGLPFFFMNMTYEVVSTKDVPLYSTSAWQDIPVSGYSFISKHYKDGIFVGDANTIFEEDEAFAHKILSQGTTTIAAIIMHGKNEPIGILGISTNDNFTVDTVDLQRILIRYSQRITSKLDVKALDIMQKEEKKWWQIF